MTAYTSLRAANEARQKLWDPDNAVSIFWRVNELAGEIGEVCNMIKKVVRQTKGLRGSRVSLPELADELADVMICADLVMLTLGEQVPTYTVNRIVPLPHDDLLIGIRLTHLSGRLCELFDNEYRPANDSVANRIYDIIVTTRAALLHFGFPVEPVISNKFNRTSEKVNLPVRLAMSPPHDARRDLETVDLNPQRRVGKAPELGMPYGDIAEQRRQQDERLLAEQAMTVGVAAGIMLAGTDDVATQQPPFADNETYRLGQCGPQDQGYPEGRHESYESPATDSPSYDCGSSDSGGGGSD